MSLLHVSVYTTIIRELVQNLAKVVFMLEHLVKLRRYMLFGDVTACHRVACALCCAQNFRMHGATIKITKDTITAALQLLI